MVWKEEWEGRVRCWDGGMCGHGVGRGAVGRRKSDGRSGIAHYGRGWCWGRRMSGE